MRNSIKDMPSEAIRKLLQGEKQTLTKVKARLVRELAERQEELDAVNRRLNEIEQGEQILAGR
ncbi:Uncharacterised protein [Mycobacteroides abscessus subsp. abscessus]|uniref:Uncharacterized protein n=1 Tax=Mycobacteroides abscessus subsp. massiliense TaxID=1962118 RepID=A0A1T8MAS0_9MYCO|nr:hypothetical protein [Mycobacteroides abscessus]MDM2320509.1 hypothetical protein [Mycobacteroides abscessus]MDM2322502.1 hypothetical protein [Mycobacteroides abscessus]MDM2326958.1 hypothetical protein [Mycobacteroides abscessus]MDM2331689.1 hypothetical protein [Mycobacteroides abscessus]MDM2337981.1 hypothetical protein [Mycobacteroides abscessus]